MVDRGVRKRAQATPVLGNVFTRFSEVERGTWVTLWSPNGAFGIQQLLVPIQQVLVPILSSPTRFWMVLEDFWMILTKDGDQRHEP